jgi:hypothetical protein
LKNTFSGYWTEGLEAALKRRLKMKKHNKPFTMSRVGPTEKEAVILAVNQGLDSRLEACYVPERGDSYRQGKRTRIAAEDSKFWKKGDELVLVRTLECEVSVESLPVLIRRLLEMDSGDSSDGGVDDAANSRASGICGCLDIELV